MGCVKHIDFSCVFQGFEGGRGGPEKKITRGPRPWALTQEVCMSMFMYVCIGMCICNLYVYVYGYVYVYLYVCVNVYVYVYVYVYV